MRGRLFRCTAAEHLAYYPFFFASVLLPLSRSGSNGTSCILPAKKALLCYPSFFRFPLVLPLYFLPL